MAVLVGGFLIFNTFAVTVAQRSREFALLRTLGASRSQILRSVVAESVVIGVVASIVGILLGLLVAALLRVLFGAIGLDLGNASAPLQPRTIIVSLLVGVIATVVSGFVPARRATRVQPVEAMREAEHACPARLRAPPHRDRAVRRGARRGPAALRPARAIPGRRQRHRVGARASARC